MYLFASEVPALFGLDKFHTRQEILDRVKSRKVSKLRAEEDIPFEIVEEDDDRPKTEEKKLQLTRELIPNVQVRGRVTVIESSSKTTILLRRRRTKNMSRRLWPNDACLAQVYLWLFNPSSSTECEVRFEETMAGEDPFTSIIRPSQTFATLQIPSLQKSLSDSLPL